MRQANRKTESPDFIPAWKSPWVWGISVIVVATLVVNFTMITIGLNTHPGLVVDDFYAKGKAYLHEDARQNETAQRLQWRMVLTPPSQPKLNQLQQYQFTLKDKVGAPINGANVTLYAYRVNDATKDFSLPMRESRSGIYSVETAFSLPGHWDLIVSAERSEEDKLDIAQRIFVQD